MLPLLLDVGRWSILLSFCRGKRGHLPYRGHPMSVPGRCCGVRAPGPNAEGSSLSEPRRHLLREHPTATPSPSASNSQSLRGPARRHSKLAYLKSDVNWT